MARLDFLAARTDLIAVLDFLYAEIDVKVFESYSRFSCELREFHSRDDLTTAFDIGTDPYGKGSAILLQLWSPTVSPQPEFKRINLYPRKCSGHTFRYEVVGRGLMQLYLGGVCGSIVTTSHFGHFERAGAEKWSAAEGVDFLALSKLSRCIQYHVRRRLAVAKALTYPILPEAFALAESGFALKYAPATVCQFRLIDGQFVQPPFAPTA